MYVNGPGSVDLNSLKALDRDSDKGRQTKKIPEKINIFIVK